MEIAISIKTIHYLLYEWTWSDVEILKWLFMWSDLKQMVAQVEY